MGTKFELIAEHIKVLNVCIEESGILELMIMTARSNRTKFSNNVLIPLLSNDLIEMAIPGKPRSSKQKYRLTPKAVHSYPKKRRWVKKLLYILKSARDTGAIILYDPNIRESLLNNSENIRNMVQENISLAHVVKDFSYAFNRRMT